jgi:putative transposase
VRLARENARWGSRRIVGELKKLGFRVSETSVRNVLRRNGIGAASPRSGPSWRTFTRQQAQSMIACDFFTVETVSLPRIYVLFFIELGTRRVHLAGSTSRHSGTWVAQQARNLAIERADHPEPLRFLVHDHDAKFSAAFDEVFRTVGVNVIRTPVKAPNANAHAERWVRTVREEWPLHQCRDVGEHRKLRPMRRQNGRKQWLGRNHRRWPCKRIAQSRRGGAIPAVHIELTLQAW